MTTGPHAHPTGEPATVHDPESSASESSVPDGASQRPPMDHPVRKAIYALAPLSDIRRGINEAALNTSALIVDLRQVGTDPETWDEVVQLRRDLRVAEMQLDHAVRAAQDWSRRAAQTGRMTSGGDRG